VLLNAGGMAKGTGLERGFNEVHRKQCLALANEHEPPLALEAMLGSTPRLSSHPSSGAFKQS
jgi:hypothetical protein